jgi:hypothetical protein
MRTTTLVLLAAVALTGCPSNPARDAGSNPGNDSGVDAAVVPGVDTGVPGMDSGPVTGTDVPIASVVNAAAADHPADGTTVHVTGNLVALSSRLFISQSTTSMRCLFAIWVGTAAGGDNSAIEVTESFLPAGSNSCFDEPAHNISDTVMIGDAITTLTGRFINFCPSGSACPANTSQELDVTAGTFTAGSHSADPTATPVSISDVAGTMLMVGPRGMALQNALVTISGTVIVTPPSMTNHNVMAVAATGTTMPVMYIQVSKYPGVGCQRTALTAMTAGATVGNITGVLTYSFGQWTIQPRQSSDIPGIMCADAGAGGDAGL